MIIIFAVNETCFRHFCKANGLPNSPKVVRYGIDHTSILGMIGDERISILTLPEWYLGKPHEEVQKIDYLINEHWKRIIGK